MSESPLRLIVLNRDDSDRIQDANRTLTDFLQRQPGVEIVTSVIVENLDHAALVNADLVMVLGGDGAILRACRRLGMRQIPVLGINLGRLGFLADLSLAEFTRCFEQIRRREFHVVEHLMFECTLRRPNGETESFLGLNEVAITAQYSLEMIEVSLSVDDTPVTTYSCDGLIVSTPVGSTAHSLSAGGPAIRQDLPVFVVTPICPHTLSNRSLVDDARRTWTLTLPSSRTQAVMIIDGQTRRPVSVGDVVEIRRADVSFKLIRLAGHNYYRVLQEKLGWSGQPRYASSDE